MARSPIRLSAEKLAEIRRVRELIEIEKPEIIEQGRKFKRQQDTMLLETCRILRDERLAQGLSLADLEERTGMTRAAISRLENAKEPNPTIGTLDRYAAGLGKRVVIRLQDQAS